MQQWLNMQMYLQASVLCRPRPNKLPLHSVLLELGCRDLVEDRNLAGFSFLPRRQSITWDPIFQVNFFFLKSSTWEERKPGWIVTREEWVWTTLLEWSIRKGAQVWRSDQIYNKYDSHHHDCGPHVTQIVNPWPGVDLTLCADMFPSAAFLWR